MAKVRHLVVVAVALVAGFVSAKYMAQGTPLVTIPWGVIAFAIGLLARTKYLNYDPKGSFSLSQRLF